MPPDSIVEGCVRRQGLWEMVRWAPRGIRDLMTDPRSFPVPSPREDPGDATRLGRVPACGHVCGGSLCSEDASVWTGRCCRSRRRTLLSRAAPYLRCSSSCAYRKCSSALRATISAWQSFTTSPWSLMCSPLMHLVPEDSTMTCACLTSRPAGQRGRQTTCVGVSPRSPLLTLTPTCRRPPATRASTVTSAHGKRRSPSPDMAAGAARRPPGGEEAWRAAGCQAEVPKVGAEPCAWPCRDGPDEPRKSCRHLPLVPWNESRIFLE